MSVPVYEVRLPVGSYTETTLPDFAAVGADLQHALTTRWEPWYLFVRCISRADHPGLTLDDLIERVRTQGHDYFDTNRHGMDEAATPPPAGWVRLPGVPTPGKSYSCDMADLCRFFYDGSWRNQVSYSGPARRGDVTCFDVIECFDMRRMTLLDHNGYAFRVGHSPLMAILKILR